MKIMLALVFAVTSLVCVLPSFATNNNLDGKTFVGTVTDSADKSVNKDNFIFENGKFRSTACDQYGYTPADYTAKPAGKATSFTATTKNSGGDTIAWKGTIVGDKLSGSAQRTTSSGKKYHMTFNGQVGKQG